MNQQLINNKNLSKNKRKRIERAGGLINFDLLKKQNIDKHHQLLEDHALQRESKR